MADVNYDEMRIGNKIRVAAGEFAKRELEKNYHPEEYDQHRERIIRDREKELIIAHNNEAMSKIPLSGVQVTELNKDVEVIRYTLRDDCSIQTGEDVIKEWNNAKIDLEFKGGQEGLDAIISKAFNIHNIAMQEAATDKRFKRFPSDALIIEDDPIDEIIAKTSSPSSDPFQTPDISATDLNARLEQLDISYLDLANTTGIHHKTVEKFTREGVPEEHKKAVYSALT